MGNGASAASLESEGASGAKLKQTFQLFGKIENRADAAFQQVDADHSGAIEKDEFLAAARAVGLTVSEAELDAVFTKFDEDGNGKIDQAEFVKFFIERQDTFFDEDAAIVDKLDKEGLKSIIPYLGPSEASSGFKKAHLILQKNKKAAGAALSPTNPMRPLHLLLMLDAPIIHDDTVKKKVNHHRAKEASQAAATAAAIPLIIEVLKCSPSCAKVRIQPKDDLPEGKLGLHMALEKRWPKAVIEALLQAYPEAATTMDPVKTKKGVPVPPTIKSGIWPRKIAEDHKCDEDVIRLLPMPKKKGTEIEWLDQEALDAADEKKKKKKGKGKKK